MKTNDYDLVISLIKEYGSIPILPSNNIFLIIKTTLVNNRDGWLSTDLKKGQENIGSSIYVGFSIFFISCGTFESSSFFSNTMI